MSSPDVALATVERLKAEGYEAGIDAVADGDTQSFVSAWATEDNTDEDAIPALVLGLDPESLHTGDEANARSHPDPAPQ